MVDLIVFIIKLFLISIDLISDNEAQVASALITTSFAIKIFICFCFLASKNDLAHNAMPCYIVRIIFDCLIIIPLTLYFTLTSGCHWLTAVIVAILIGISELVSFTCCINDARKYSKWLLQNSASLKQQKQSNILQ